MRALRPTLLLAAALVIPGKGPLAQMGASKGLFAGIHYSGASLDLSGASEAVDFGSGFGVHAGLGLGNRLQLLVNYDRNTLPSNLPGANADLAQFDALARLFLLLPQGSPLRLYATGGVTGRTIKLGQEFDGLSPTGGAGLLLKVLPSIALTGTALWTFGNLTSSTQLANRTGTEFRSTGVRVQVGASLFLLGN
jgi:hypothetical protein